MEIFLFIVYVACIYYSWKIFMLLFSCLTYKIKNFSIKKVRIDGIFNQLDTKGMVILAIPITNKLNMNENIVNHYKNIITGYKKVKVVFITSEKEEIEIKLKHNDEKNVRDILLSQIEETNKKLDRSDAMTLIHYPYDDDNKSRMIEYAIKEFMQKYSTIEKMSSYIGIFDSSSIPNESLISMLEKTLKKYKYPKIIELVNIYSLLLDKQFYDNKKDSSKNNKWLLYLYNVNKSINEFLKTNGYRILRKITFTEKLLPNDINLNGSFIRLDLFYEEEMFGMCQMKEVISINYYFKDAKVKTLYLINNNQVVTKENEIENELEDKYTYLHLLKTQCIKINKYRLPNKQKTSIVKILANMRMTLMAVSSYTFALSLLTIIFAKEISINKLILIISLIYTFILLSMVIYDILTISSREKNKYKNKVITKILSFIMYPLYLLYKTNGFYDYIKHRSKVNQVSITNSKEIR